MKAERISIKWMTITVLVSLAVVMLISSIVAGEQYRATALDFQKVAIAKSMDIAVKEQMKHLYSVTMDLNAGTQDADGFKSLAGAVLRGSDDAQAKTDLVKLLDDQFAQRSVNSGIVDLKKLKIYDTKLNLVVESNKGIAQQRVPMPKPLYNLAKSREGADRLKVLDVIWKSGDDTYYSLLLPVGGLRLMGYIEVVVNPVPALKGISEILQLPVMIESNKGKRLAITDDWAKKETKTSLAIPFEMKVDDGAIGLRLFSLGNMSGLHARMTKTQWTMVGIALMLLALVICISMWLFNWLLYTPVKNLVANMQRCAGGDLTVEVESHGLSDLRVISGGLRDIVESLQNQVLAIGANADQVASASTELSTITTKMGRGASLQSAKTQEVATSMNEMATSITEVAQNAVSAADAAKQADEDAKKGQKVVADAVEVINSLTSEVEKTSIAIRNLEEESSGIGKVLDVIRGIADQTNLLALNAAIEAARAGEQGRGFAVVADEVRSLASKTQESTHEIQTMIEKLQAGAQEAVHAMDTGKARARESVEQTSNINEMLGAMVKAIETVADMNNQIAVAAEQQGVVSHQVNENIIEINDLSMSSAQYAEKTAKNSEELAGLAGSLQRLISDFKVD